MSLNVWNYKPKWCQPWSIVSTGVATITVVWFLSKIIWLTGVVSLLVFLWWFYFLIIYPKAFEKIIINKDN